MKKTGKVITLPLVRKHEVSVQGISTGTFVLARKIFPILKTTYFVAKIRRFVNAEWCLLDQLDGKEIIGQWRINDLKILIVETREGTDDSHIKQFPLEEMQWELANQKDLIDADKEIQVQINPDVASASYDRVAMITSLKISQEKQYTAREVRKIAIEFADRVLNSPSDFDKAGSLQKFYDKYFNV